MANQPQINYQSNQNYDVDIKKLFKHYVTGGNTPNDNEPGENIGIDDLRAQINVSITGMKTSQLIAALNINPNSNTSAPNTPNTTTPVSFAQESRCHAFYRILGLPVVSSDASQFYNAGFDIVKQPGVTRQIDLPTKITIASNVGEQFEAISAARETWAATTAQLFSSPTSVEAGVLSLTSGTYGSNGIINIRAFNILKKVTQPFDYNPNDQSYNSVPSQSCLVGNKGPQLLTNFQDGNGNTILANIGGNTKNPSTAFFNHFHIIAPFNVDPRIDFSIWSKESKTFSASSRRIAVPFVPDASYLQVNSVSNAIRPVIEGIIRKRIYQANQQTAAGDSVANAQAVIANDPNIGSIPFIGSTPISNIFSNSVFNLSQQNAFADTLSIIQTMIKKLVESLHIIHHVQGLYYWLPIPNTTGPEGGSDIRDVPLNTNFSQSLITNKDFDIIYNLSQVIFSNISAAATQANAIPDAGGYAFNFNSSPLSFTKDTTDAQGNISGNTMNILGKRRNKSLNDAGNALQIVEMIMGEFSGLGLCDIIAIIGTLYVMNINDLLGLLDIDAYNRAQALLGSNLPAQTNSITQSLTSLLQGVSGFYQVMDQIFTDTIGNQSLNQ